MTMSEFDVIERYFRQDRPLRDDVVLGIGDDAALLNVPANRHLVVTVDTLIAGRHFPHDTGAADVAYKALAVNLSDLAAMGAVPAWATLALTLPAADDHWLRAFADAFFGLAGRYGVDLIGGDTTRGPLSITLQLHGLVQAGREMRRADARPGQKVFVTGTLGDAACALRTIRAGGTVDPNLLKRLNRPEPRLAFGQALAGIGAAAIDISDGLLADLGHIADASRCGASVWVDRLPRSPSLRDRAAAEVLACQLQGGDDYELCFTLDADRVGDMQAIAREHQLSVTEIGVIEQQPGLRCRHDDGSVYPVQVCGYDHFIHENK